MCKFLPIIPSIISLTAALTLAGCKPDSDFESAAPTQAQIPASATGETSEEAKHYLKALYAHIDKIGAHGSHDYAIRPTAGEAIIFFRIKMDGDLVRSSIYKSSGYPDIDQEALAAVKASAPFPKPPTGIPVTFFYHKKVKTPDDLRSK